MRQHYRHMMREYWQTSSALPRTKCATCFWAITRGCGTLEVSHNTVTPRRCLVLGSRQASQKYEGCVRGCVVAWMVACFRPVCRLQQQNHIMRFRKKLDAAPTGQSDESAPARAPPAPAHAWRDRERRCRAPDIMPFRNTFPSKPSRTVRWGRRASAGAAARTTLVASVWLDRLHPTGRLVPSSMSITSASRSSQQCQGR